MSTLTQDDTTVRSTTAPEPVMTGRGLVKRYGHVTAINGADFDLYPGEVLAIVGDNGAGKSSLIKAHRCRHSGRGHDHAGRQGGEVPLSAGGAA